MEVRTPRPTDLIAASHLSGSPAQGLPRRPRPRLRRRSCWPRCCCWCTSCARCTRCCSRRRAPWWLPIGCPSLRSSRSAATPPPSPRCPPRSLQGGASGAWRQMPAESTRTSGRRRPVFSPLRLCEFKNRFFLRKNRLAVNVKELNRSNRGNPFIHPGGKKNLFLLHSDVEVHKTLQVILKVVFLCARKVIHLWN